MYITLLLCVCFFAVEYSEQKSDYVAAVVEFQLMENSSMVLEEYVYYIMMAAEKNADIVVFPEMHPVSESESVTVPMYGLLFTNPIPALDPELYDGTLVRISEAARDNDIYVVINIQEQMDCNETVSEYCPENKVYYFSTNVVFDRNGTVIDRYRKINLSGDDTRSPALKPELGIFHTDFGVTFAHFISLDIMFQAPSIQVFTKLKDDVNDVIYPTMWASEMPYLTAVQVQQSYANALNINLIAANANNITSGYAGSGIYAGKFHTLVSQISGVPGTKLLVVPVEKTPGMIDRNYDYPAQIVDKPSDPDDLVLMKDPELHKRVSRKLGTGHVDIEVKDGEVTCRVNATIKQLNDGETYNYRLFVHHGVRTYSKRRLGVAVCSIVACKNDNVTSCPFRFSKDETNLEIKHIIIIMTAVKPNYNQILDSTNILYVPQSLRTNKFPLDPTEFFFIPVTFPNYKFITYETIKPHNDLISFGVWARMYDNDKPKVANTVSRSMAVRLLFTPTIMYLSTVLVYHLS